MRKRRSPLAFGLACLVLGWTTAGCLEWIGASVWTATGALVILVIVVAVGSDWLFPRGGD